MAEVTSALGSACEAMAEVTRALGKMQFDTEGGRVRATYEMAVERNKAVGSFIVEIGDDVTKAELGNEVAAGRFTRETGFTNAELGNIVLIKEAAGSSTGEIGVTEAGLGSKEAAGTGMVTAASGINLAAWSEKPREERKAEPVAVALLTKERVPEAYIEGIKTRPLRKSRPLKDSIARGNPKHREMYLATKAHIDYLVDLEQDCLRQHAEKGYAEIGVDYSDGFKKVFILPKDCQRQYAEKGYADFCVDYPDGFKKVFIIPKPVD